MFADPQFWVFVAFIIFIILIFKPAKKNLISNLDNKINEIKNSINEAEKIKNDAQQTLSEIKKRQNGIKNEIEIIHQEAKIKITALEENTKQKLKEQIDKRKNLAKIKIDQMTRDYTLEIHKYIVENTINNTLKILINKLDKNEKQKFINQSIIELNSVLKH